MSDFWFQHLSATLSERGLIAYIWHVEEDRFEWAGNLYEAFGLQDADRPASNAQFHKLLNPQNVPQRLTSLHEVLNRPAAADGAPAAFSARYKIRNADGGHVEIEESAILRAPADGKRSLCGFLKIREAEQLLRPAPQQPEKSPSAVVLGSAMTHQGRRALQRRMEEWFATTAAQGAVAGYLLVVGMDRMTLMNEAFGASFVDELIEKTGQRLAQIAGDAGYVARIDGDVFGVFFHHAPYSEMAAVARYILNNFSQSPAQTSRGPMGIGISIGGMSITGEDRSSVSSIITKGEMAMQAAKDRGRGCFISYGEAASQAAGNLSMIEAGEQFMKALKHNRVRLAFQPVVGAQSEQVTFHECLIRMLDNDGKLVAAGQFIPAIEKMGLSRLVDQYAMRTAIQELTLFPELSLSVNVSNLTLTNPDWLRGVVAALRDRPSVAGRMIVEITESAVIKDMRQTIRVSKTLKELGCRIALDDFGTGYTAFSQIKDMNVDIVKIDKSFVRNLDDSHNKLFVSTLQSLADGVNVETVGEGAESAEDAQKLAKGGIDHIQGYVYGFPRVERVWLPKDHAYRAIPLTAGKKEFERAAHEETLKDISQFRS